MKKCTGCGQEKTLDEFAWKSKAKGTRSARCKECHKAYSVQHYLTNTQMYKDKANRNRQTYRPRGKEFVVAYLENHPCVDCGNSDINVLEFDHVDELKNWRAPRVTSLLGHSISRIQSEIDKCEVRCANCHLRKTRTRAGTLRV